MNYIFKLICRNALVYCFIEISIIFSSAAQTSGSDLMDAESLSALHLLAIADSPPFSLFTVMAQSGAIDRIVNISSAIDRPPDAYLFFDGTHQHQTYCLVDPKTSQEVSSLSQGSVICAITLDDNIADQYRIAVEYQQDTSKEWRIAERVTSLFSPLTGVGRIIPLHSDALPDIPYYIASVDFYRAVSPCLLRAEVMPLPGTSLPRTYIGWGLGGGFTIQDKSNLLFHGDTVNVLTSNSSELSGNGILGVSLFPGRDPFRNYTASFWKANFYREFFRRWSLQAGLAFTRSDQLLKHYIVGFGFRLFRSLDLTATTLFTSRPKENTISIISPQDHNRAEQLVAQQREELFLLGMHINIMEW